SLVVAQLFRAAPPRRSIRPSVGPWSGGQVRPRQGGAISASVGSEVPGIPGPGRGRRCAFRGRPRGTRIANAPTDRRGLENASSRAIGARRMKLVSKRSAPSAKGLAASGSAVVFVGYVALLCLVTVIGAVAVVGLGIPLLKLYRFAQTALSLPIP